MAFYLFDIRNSDLVDLKIEENDNFNNCFIKNIKTNDCYSGFILYKSRITISCEITFYKSSKTNKYIPRLIFKKLDKDGNEKFIDNKKPINIELNDSEKAEPFWKMVAFIQNFKELVDIEKFKDTYKVSKIQNDLTDENVLNYLKTNSTLLNKIVENDLTETDVISIGYRKKQLESFETMLKNNDSKESDWQNFFEKNSWIFGYGLSYIFNESVIDQKLEQYTSGFDFNSNGKRTDALLKTSGFIKSLCFVEIKTHKTQLLKQIKNAYRGDSWAISDELAGGVTQLQNTVIANLKNWYGKISLKDKKTGDLTGEDIFNFQPKSFLVIGKLDEFIGTYGVNEDKYRSFELFRRNINSPEIITFDELYERARFIVDTKVKNEL